jgi:hypothetical protein
MNKNQIRGLRCRASGHMTAKPIFINVTGGKSGGCALKAVELTWGDLRHVANSRLKGKRFTLTVPQESAEGVVLQKTEGRPERCPARGVKGKASK